MQPCRCTSSAGCEGDLEMGHDDRHRATSRRRILTALAATAGGAALLPRYGLQAQQAPTTRRLVDTHHHYYPREIIEAWQGYMTRNSEGRLQPNVANWAPAASLEEMDKSGVGTSILSLASIPGVWFGLDPPGMRRMHGCATNSRRGWSRMIRAAMGSSLRCRCRMSTDRSPRSPTHSTA